MMSDKWSFLYNYSRKAFDDEIARFSRLDEKAVKFITATSVIITAFIALSKWVFSGNNNFTIYVFLISGIIFILLCAAWIFYFLSLKLTVVPKMPLTDETFELIKNNNISTVNVALYKAARNAVEEISLTINKKSKYLVNGFKCTLIAGLFLILFVSMIVVESIDFKSIFCANNSQQTEESIMTEKETTQSQSTTTTNQQPNNEPDLDVNAPNLQHATEGLDSLPDNKMQILNEGHDKKK